MTTPSVYQLDENHMVIPVALFMRLWRAANQAEAPEPAEPTMEEGDLPNPDNDDIFEELGSFVEGVRMGDPAAVGKVLGGFHYQGEDEE